MNENKAISQPSYVEGWKLELQLKWVTLLGVIKTRKDIELKYIITRKINASFK